MANRGELSLSLAGLERVAGAPWAAGPRAAIEWAASTGFRAVQLDGAAAGTRARELDRSARRDIAGLLRRHGLALSGIDLWIPPSHFASTAEADRAVAAVVGAADLAAEISKLVPGSIALVSVTMPEVSAPGVERALEAAGARAGTAVADHAWPVRPESLLGVGIDPAALILANADVPMAVAGLVRSPSSARWSDLSAGGRVLPGDGKLECAMYDAALSARGFLGYRIVDLRGLRDQAAAAKEILKRLAPVSP